MGSWICGHQENWTAKKRLADSRRGCVGGTSLDDPEDVPPKLGFLLQQPKPVDARAEGHASDDSVRDRSVWRTGVLITLEKEKGKND